MKILVTGGAGYIGSSICSALLDSGHIPIILDSLITGKIEFTKNRIFYKGDIGDKAIIQKIFTEHPDIENVIHCAALIVIPDSVENPYKYYNENVVKSLNLFKNLADLNKKNIIFSSSASLYDKVPGYMVTEDSPLNPNCPYARTKYMMEMILKDFCCAYGLQAISLRYFNPIGADLRMRTGPHQKNPSHLLARLINVALGKEEVFKITGTNWDTRDGTAIRDYIHIWDIAMAHVKAIEKFSDIFKNKKEVENGYIVINLGTSTGLTVREFVKAFEEVWGKEIKKVEAPPRPGDVIGAFANSDKAKRLLDWNLEFTLQDGIKHSLEWGEKRKEILGY